MSARWVIFELADGSVETLNMDEACRIRRGVEPGTMEIQFLWSSSLKVKGDFEELMLHLGAEAFEP
jgi:hypothetical protein